MQTPEQVSGTDALKVATWRTWGDYDYVAARRLLLDNLLVQGAGLANTAIEKYIKAILTIQKRRVPRSHDPLDLYRQIKPGGTLVLDEDFLRVLVKAYTLRYPDDLQPGFNIALKQPLLLGALDRTIFDIRSHFGFRYEDGTGRPVGRPYTGFLDHLIDVRDEKIFTDNIALGTITQEALFNRHSQIFEMRITPKGDSHEHFYTTDRIKNRSFTCEGLVQKSETEFTLSETPNLSGGGEKLAP